MLLYSVANLGSGTLKGVRLCVEDPIIQVQHVVILKDQPEVFESLRHPKRLLSMLDFTQKRETSE